MKAKANQLLKTLPEAEKIIYNECRRDAKNISCAAKCLVSLMNIRDRLLQVKNNLINSKVNKVMERKIYTNKTLDELKYSIYKKKNKFKLKKVEIKIQKNTNSIRKGKTYKSYFSLPKGYDNVNLIVKRPKRNVIQQDNSNTSEGNNYVKKILRLEKYQQMCDHVKKYFDRINEENTKILSKYHNPVVIETMEEKNNSDTVINNLLKKLTQLLNQFITSSKNYSFLSPKLFNIIPSCKFIKCDNIMKILSPTLLSFHENDGLFSLPSLIKLSTSNEIEANYWLNLLLQYSGGGDKLSKLMEEMEPKIKQMEEVIYPSIIKIEKMEEIYRKIYQNLNIKQKEDIQSNGYTFLSSDQMSKTLDFQDTSSLRDNMLLQMSKEDHERQLEKNLKKLASNDSSLYKKMNNNSNDFLLNRYKRATTNNSDPLNDYEGHHNTGFFNIFKPSAFLNVVGVPVVFEAILLSPHAFIGEILNPEFGIVNILSPRAFVATILSPNALLSRILQPGFFRAEVLTPRALNSWVLSPDAFIAEVLSPKFLEAKILSPELFAIQVLSPRVLTASVASSEIFAIHVLSPSVLSPSVLGKNSMIVEVLSPHLLSGDHEGEHEDDHGNEKEKETNSTTVIM